MAEVKREIIYREIDGDYEPFLSISPKVPGADHQANFAIRMEDLWMYTPDKNPAFDTWMYQVCEGIMRQFNLGLITCQRMAEIATVIEDGIDELLQAPPEPPTCSNLREAFERAIATAKKEDKGIADISWSITEHE